MRLKLEPNINYGQTIGAVYPFQIKDLKETLIEIIQILDEAESKGYEPWGIRLNESWDDRNSKRLEIYLKNTQRFITKAETNDGTS